MEELTQEQIRKKEILESLKNWKDKPASEVEPFNVFFAQHRKFNFQCYYHETTCVTVYFGLTLNLDGEQAIVAHVIPEYLDESDLAYNYVLTCPVEINTSLNNIDSREARKRIARWEKYGESWMEKYEGEFFRAISIPVEDFKPEKNSFTAFFALKEVTKEVDGKSVLKLDFDLILQREGEEVYLDTVHLIPPLRPQKMYILSQIPAEISAF